MMSADLTLDRIAAIEWGLEGEKPTARAWVEISVMRSLLALAREALEKREGWRDIATNPPPKNGTEVLLWGECSRDGERYPADANVGWWFEGDRWRTRCPDERINPTHWQPLPSPPGSSLPKPAEAARGLADRLEARRHPGKWPDELVADPLDQEAAAALRAAPGSPPQPEQERGMVKWVPLSGRNDRHTCASEGCGNTARWRMEAGGVGSYYCTPCATKTKAALSSFPETNDGK